MPGQDEKRLEIAQKFFVNEYVDHAVYLALSRSERRHELRLLFERLAGMEAGHMVVWEKEILSCAGIPRKPSLVGLRVAGFRLIKGILGPSFMTKLLERHEIEGIAEYESAVKSGIFGSSGSKAIRRIIAEEKTHEKSLLREIEARKGSLAYVNSIVLGLSDSLVEVLAAVVGIAAFATAASIVIVGGIIVGMAGTLSMAGGVYLASKSQNIVETAMESGRQKKASRTEPSKEAYYTGVFYFFGALVPIIPFLLGFTRYAGILLAVLFDVIALVIASVVIAIVSDTSIRRRTFEMLAITLGTAVVTMLIGTLARVYFGVTI
ncbi:MAG: VIT1/CCC1 transporter family protein [Candidatus Micrarchaeota archaeon]|nr:VIT1/CCC1 transporter family protein [Candidatus Micrarchaeota archaeon]MDE1805013.1 VIT1/CCC1 transporter family protein [Candidatus Micrarchaeota archaeon]MDE1847242.1 VIT1/CCC1 transporter family protein [Candidatus Micrarchaeota archaeon]